MKKTGPIQAEELLPNTIIIRVPAIVLGKRTGLAADATGVVVESAPIKFSRRHVKKIILYTSVSNVPSDAEITVGVYDKTRRLYVVKHTYSGTGGEATEEYSGTMIFDNDVLVVRVEVTTASATTGATFDLDFASAMIEYGVA